MSVVITLRVLISLSRSEKTTLHNALSGSFGLAQNAADP